MTRRRQLSRQKQQKIIDKFIRTKPKMPKNRHAVTALDDLAEMSYTPNKRAVSETLAQVLIAQGKRNEAIELLRKLIWKIPQKKKLFMSQIKALESLP